PRWQPENDRPDRHAEVASPAPQEQFRASTALRAGVRSPPLSNLVDCRPVVCALWRATAAPPTCSRERAIPRSARLTTRAARAAKVVWAPPCSKAKYGCPIRVSIPQRLDSPRVNYRRYDVARDSHGSGHRADPTFFLHIR